AVRGDASGGGRVTCRGCRSRYRWGAGTAGPTRAQAPSADNVHLPRVRRGGRFDELWSESPCHASARRLLRRSVATRRQARRPTRRTADTVRAGDQLQDCEGPRLDDPSIALSSSGRNSPMITRRTFLCGLTLGTLAAG